MTLIGDHITLTSFLGDKSHTLFSGRATITGGLAFSSANLMQNAPPPNIKNVLPTITISGNRIVINYPLSEAGTHFTSSTFNGLEFQTASTDPAFGFAHITGTNIPQLTDADLKVNAHTLDINVENLFLPQNTAGFIDLVVGSGPPFYELNSAGQNVFWANPRNITVDESGILPQWRGLVATAEKIWTTWANVHFVDVTGTSQAASANIKIDYQKLHPSTTGEFGDTHLQFISDPNSFTGASNHIANAEIAIEDPTERTVTALGDGDFQYAAANPADHPPSVLEVLSHEIGHALGLAHNFADPTSIMAPTDANALLDRGDVAAIQQLYGPAPGSSLPMLPPSESGF